MALLCPTLPPRPALSAGDHAERALLDILERGLPDAFTLFHSVDWRRADGAVEQRGELDIVVLNQAGDVLLLEVKAGAVQAAEGQLHKTYGPAHDAQTKNVLWQARRQLDGIAHRLAQDGLGVAVHHLLVLPDARVAAGSVRWPRERIVDSTQMPQLVTQVRQLLGVGLPDATRARRVRDFFENRLALAPDVSALAGRLSEAVIQLSAGLATWVPRLEVPSGLVRVRGTAGSGKTQLALRLLRDAAANGQRAAYLCFNRALADQMLRCAPARVTVETFHELALRLARQAGMAPDLAAPDAFDSAAHAAVQRLEATPPDLDLLVLDELQDWQPAWVQALLARLKPDARAVLLEDPDQQLYTDRLAFDMPEAVVVHATENFRSPRALVALAGLLRLTDTPVQALSPHAGELPEPIAFDDDADAGPPGAGTDLLAATGQGVQRCLDRGFALDDIAVISLRGRAGSRLLHLDQLPAAGRRGAPAWALRRFTGAFDAAGNACWTAGPLLMESVRRFKGQSAPAVVLTECDLPDLDGLNARLLFTGLTRARLHLEWVISARMDRMLQQRLSAA